MREIFYQFNTSGSYRTEQSTAFGEDSHLKIIIEPHDFSISVSNEVLRSSSCAGYTAVVSACGEATIYDNEGNVIAQAEKGAKSYNALRLDWKQDLLVIEFGYTDVVDYYPNCDGESDRWGEKWIAERVLKLDLSNNSVDVK